MNKRNSSFELLRIICVTLIVMMHISSLLNYEEASTMNRFIRVGINSIGNIGVSCFILISGYFGIKCRMEKFIYLVLSATLYGTIVAYLNYRMDLMQLAKGILSVIGYTNWFIACYIIIMLISPYLNKFSSLLTKGEFKKLLFIFFIVFSVLPSITYVGSLNNVVLRQGGKCLTYFVFIYLIGRYIRLHHDLLYKRISLFFTHLLCTVIIFFLNITVSKIMNQECVYFNFDCSPLILCSSLCVFFLFKSWHFNSSWVNVISSSVFTFYLFSNMYYWIDSNYIHLATFSANPIFFVLLLTEVFIIAMVSLIVDKTIGIIIRRIVDPFAIIINKISFRIGQNISNR